MGRPPKSFESFYATVPESGCWLWLGFWDRDGYGKYARKSNRAHRESYEIHVGHIPEGMVVMHKCDTPSCVNPSHLKLGSVRENNEDRNNKFRSRQRISQEDAITIRLSSDPIRSLAARFGVSAGAIFHIRHNRTMGMDGVPPPEKKASMARKGRRPVQELEASE